MTNAFNVELLAPAGSREAAVAAIEAGADAIYLGGKMFGARHYAPNFDESMLAEVVRLAHLRGVLVYVTVNTLVDNGELTALVEYLRHLYQIGVDAIIVQDVGVARVAQQVVPNLPLHASTQMTVYNLAGVKFLARQGFTRVVLARELSLADIRYICQNSPIEIETFVHGALCISYSGQCLMSSMIGGRSGNRGRCAQPCRLKYMLVDQDGRQVLSPEAAGEYLLSPKDLCTLELLPELIKAGVASFKMEGRMKRAEYVAIAVDTYRQAINRFLKNDSDYAVQPQELKDLAQSFNRGFTTAYLRKKEGRFMMSDRRPNNRGVHVGRVTGYDSKRKLASIKLEERLAVGDIIECWVKVGGRVNITVSALLLSGQPVLDAEPGQEVAVRVDSPVKLNDRVFKTFDSQLTAKARSFFAEGEIRRRVGVDITVTANLGQPLIIALVDEDGYQGQAATVFIVEKAQKHPLTEETIAKQAGRLGNTVFAMNNLICNIEPGIMAPVSEINDARRRALKALEAARLEKFDRPPLPPVITVLPDMPRKIQRMEQKPELAVHVDTVVKAEAALKNGADIILFGGESFAHQVIQPDDYRHAVSLARQHGKKVILNTPRIIKEWQMPQLTANLELFEELRPDSIGVANLGTFEIAKRLTTCQLHGDFSLNIYNGAAVRFSQEQGFASLTLSPELNLSQVEDLVSRFDFPLECMVHGCITLMVSEHCLLGSHLGGLQGDSCSKACEKGRYYLKDRMNERFPVVTDQFCRMHILNAKELSMLPYVGALARAGVRRIRIEAKYSDLQHVCQVTNLYRRLLDSRNPEGLTGDIAEIEHKDITRGHYFRGVL